MISSIFIDLQIVPYIAIFFLSFFNFVSIVQGQNSHLSYIYGEFERTLIQVRKTPRDFRRPLLEWPRKRRTARTDGDDEKGATYSRIRLLLAVTELMAAHGPSLPEIISAFPARTHPRMAAASSKVPLWLISLLITAPKLSTNFRRGPVL